MRIDTIYVWQIIGIHFGQSMHNTAHLYAVYPRRYKLQVSYDFTEYVSDLCLGSAHDLLLASRNDMHSTNLF